MGVAECRHQRHGAASALNGTTPQTAGATRNTGYSSTMPESVRSGVSPASDDLLTGCGDFGGRVGADLLKFAPDVLAQHHRPSAYLMDAAKSPDIAASCGPHVDQP
jgi:hypothetical protein